MAVTQELRESVAAVLEAHAEMGPSEAGRVYYCQCGKSVGAVWHGKDGLRRRMAQHQTLALEEAGCLG